MNTFENIINQLRGKMNENTLGFANDKKPMQQARIQDTLNTLVDYRNTEGVIATEKEFITAQLLSGSTVSKDENYQTYKRNGELTKPKKAYFLNTEQHSHFITKTAFDFANYLIDNDLLNVELVLDLISKETLQKEEVERIKVEQERKEREELERKQKEEKEKQDKINAEKVANWTAKGNELINNDIKFELKNIVKNVAESFGYKGEEEELNNHYDNVVNQFVISVGDEGYTRYFIDMILDGEINNDHANNAMNKEMYFYLIGLKEDMSKKEIKSKINDFYNKVSKVA